jgi:acyl carrier protein
VTCNRIGARVVRSAAILPLAAGQRRGGDTEDQHDHGATSQLPDAETTLRAETIIYATIRRLLEQREAEGTEIARDSKLTADLGLDSLELAELSAVLEDDIGRDPFSEGIVPETVGELIDYYDG